MKEGLAAEEVEALYRRYAFFVRRRCRLLLRDPVSADDVLQETFVNVLRRGEEMRQAREPLHFLYRVADRACFDHLRKRRAHPLARHAADDGAASAPCHPGASPELRAAAIELLATFDDESQRIAVMAFVDGMTHEEIGTELGYSRMTILKRIAAIRAQAEAWAAGRPRRREVLP